MSETKKPIILCAGQNGRAVIYGQVDSDPVPGQAVRLVNARMVLYWDQKCGGLFGLAAQGPKGATRITHAIPETVETVWQEWIAVAEGAVPKFADWVAWDG